VENKKRERIADTLGLITWFMIGKKSLRETPARQLHLESQLEAARKTALKKQKKLDKEKEREREKEEAPKNFPGQQFFKKLSSRKKDQKGSGEEASGLLSVAEGVEQEEIELFDKESESHKNFLQRLREAELDPRGDPLEEIAEQEAAKEVCLSPRTPSSRREQKEVPVHRRSLSQGDKPARKTPEHPELVYWPPLDQIRNKGDLAFGDFGQFDAVAQPERSVTEVVVGGLFSTAKKAAAGTYHYFVNRQAAEPELTPAAARDPFERLLHGTPLEKGDPVIEFGDEPVDQDQERGDQFAQNLEPYE